MSQPRPDRNTFLSVLPACADVAESMQHVKQIQHDIIEGGFEFDIVVGIALMDMYAKCKNMDIARKLFDKMPKRDLVLWSAMIVGYAQSGDYTHEALTFFNKMLLEGFVPDLITMSSVLRACAHLAALQQGKAIHGWIIRSELKVDSFVATALIDMYAKCGSL